MTPKEASRKAWAEMKQKPFKERLAYFWDYYKWHTLAVLALVIVAISYTVSILREPDYKANGLLLNAYSYSNYEQIQANIQSLADGFSKAEDLDDKNVEVNLDGSRVYYLDEENDAYNADTIQLILTYVASESLDFIIGDEDAMLELAYMQMFQDLSSILNDEQLQKLDDSVLYIDMAVVEKREAALDQDLDTSDIVYPDPTKPERMERPAPVFVRLAQSDKLNGIYTQSSESLVFGFTGRNQGGYAEAFLNYLLEND